MNKVAETIKDQFDYLSNEYTINNGIIQDPGKFEGSADYALYFHDCVMNGGGNEQFYGNDDTIYDVFIITDSEREVFYFDARSYVVIYHQDNNGFVHCYEYSRTEYNNFLDEIESEFV